VGWAYFSLGGNIISCGTSGCDTGNEFESYSSRGLDNCASTEDQLLGGLGVGVILAFVTTLCCVLRSVTDCGCDNLFQWVAILGALASTAFGCAAYSIFLENCVYSDLFNLVSNNGGAESDVKLGYGAICILMGMICYVGTALCAFIYEPIVEENKK